MELSFDLLHPQVYLLSGVCFLVNHDMNFMNLEFARFVVSRLGVV